MARGLRELREGKTLSHWEVKRSLAKWLQSAAHNFQCSGSSIMNPLEIEWRHLDKEGNTCVRCSETGAALK